jgi:hypothetical protein
LTAPLNPATDARFSCLNPAQYCPSPPRKGRAFAQGARQVKPAGRPPSLSRTTRRLSGGRGSLPTGCASLGRSDLTTFRSSDSARVDGALSRVGPSTASALPQAYGRYAACRDLQRILIGHRLLASLVPRVDLIGEDRRAAGPCSSPDPILLAAADVGQPDRLPGFHVAGSSASTGCGARSASRFLRPRRGHRRGHPHQGPAPSAAMARLVACSTTPRRTSVAASARASMSFGSPKTCRDGAARASGSHHRDARGGARSSAAGARGPSAAPRGLKVTDRRYALLPTTW